MTGVIIYRYMEIYKETSGVAIFILNTPKCHFFLFCPFSSIKPESRRAEQVLPRVGELLPVGREKWQRNEVGGPTYCANIVYTYM
jgi:hypothetical protein